MWVSLAAYAYGSGYDCVMLFVGGSRFSCVGEWVLGTGFDGLLVCADLRIHVL